MKREAMNATTAEAVRLFQQGQQRSIADQLTMLS